MSRYLTHALVAVLALVLVSALVNRAKWVATAEAAEDRADSLAELVDELAAENARQIARVFARDSAYRVDSLAWVAERASLTAQASDARVQGARAATALRARLDGLGVALMAEYEAEVQREREAAAAILETVRAELGAARERIRERDKLIRGLYAEIDIREAEAVELRTAVDAYRNAVAPSLVSRIWESKEIVAVSLALGALAWEIAR